MYAYDGSDSDLLRPPNTAFVAALTHHSPVRSAAPPAIPSSAASRPHHATTFSSSSTRLFDSFTNRRMRSAVDILQQRYATTLHALQQLEAHDGVMETQSRMEQLIRERNEQAQKYVEDTPRATPVPRTMHQQQQPSRQPYYHPQTNPSPAASLQSPFEAHASSMAPMQAAPSLILSHSHIDANAQLRADVAEQKIQSRLKHVERALNSLVESRRDDAPVAAVLPVAPLSSSYVHHPSHHLQQPSASSPPSKHHHSSSHRHRSSSKKKKRSSDIPKHVERLMKIQGNSSTERIDDDSDEEPRIASSPLLRASPSIQPFRGPTPLPPSQPQPFTTSHRTTSKRPTVQQLAQTFLVRDAPIDEALNATRSRADEILAAAAAAAATSSIRPTASTSNVHVHLHPNGDVGVTNGNGERSFHSLQQNAINPAAASTSGFRVSSSEPLSRSQLHSPHSSPTKPSFDAESEYLHSLQTNDASLNHSPDRHHPTASPPSHIPNVRDDALISTVLGAVNNHSQTRTPHKQSQRPASSPLRRHVHQSPQKRTPLKHAPSASSSRHYNPSSSTYSTASASSVPARAFFQPNPSPPKARRSLAAAATTLQQRYPPVLQHQLNEQARRFDDIEEKDNNTAAPRHPATHHPSQSHLADTSLMSPSRLASYLRHYLYYRPPSPSSTASNAFTRNEQHKLEHLVDELNGLRAAYEWKKDGTKCVTTSVKIGVADEERSAKLRLSQRKQRRSDRNESPPTRSSTVGDLTDPHAARLIQEANEEHAAFLESLKKVAHNHEKMGVLRKKSDKNRSGGTKQPAQKKTTVSRSRNTSWNPTRAAMMSVKNNKRI